MTDLFTPFDLHGLPLPNRVLMSAMTRTRASEDGVPTDLMLDYYVQRASSGLIVTECVQVSDQAHGIIGVPYIANPDLLQRFETDGPLNKPNPALFYGTGAAGYTDYPALAA